jgi:hypothetical protein
MRTKTLFSVLIALLVGMCISCRSKKAELDGYHGYLVKSYRVMSYDAATKHWTIVRAGTFDGESLRERLTVVCSLYKRGQNATDYGPDACDLKVGRLLVPNHFPPAEKPEDFLLISEFAKVLAINEGQGASSVMQQFIILKDDVLSDDCQLIPK